MIGMFMSASVVPTWATPSSFSAARRAAQSATGMKVGFGILGILLGGQTDSAT